MNWPVVSMSEVDVVVVRIKYIRRTACRKDLGRNVFEYEMYYVMLVVYTCVELGKHKNEAGRCINYENFWGGLSWRSCSPGLAV